MSRGKHLSLEEARKNSKLDRFTKEPHSEADRVRFLALLDAMSQGVLEEAETLKPDRRANSNETQTQRGT